MTLPDFGEMRRKAEAQFVERRKECTKDYPDGHPEECVVAMPNACSVCPKRTELFEKEQIAAHVIALDDERLRQARRAEEAERRLEALDLVCEGCGSTRSVDEMRAESPKALSCCPERRMWPRKAVADRDRLAAELEEVRKARANETDDHGNTNYAKCGCGAVVNLMLKANRQHAPMPIEAFNTARDRAELIARAQAAESALAEREKAISYAIELLMETAYGNPARSPAHNARIVLQGSIRSAHTVAEGEGGAEISP